MKSRKQIAIIDHLCRHGDITIEEAVLIVGGNIYANERFHVGNILRNMVKRGYIQRVQRGVYSLIEAPDLPGNEATNEA